MTWVKGVAFFLIPVLITGSGVAVGWAVFDGRVRPEHVALVTATLGLVSGSFALVKDSIDLRGRWRSAAELLAVPAVPLTLMTTLALAVAAVSPSFSAA